ncbi:MAG: NADH-quinone oxidoreductase subunit K [Thaumarchaeota archaeon]|nr:NADH-quinone oxidoreductase subunit K [Candidatus Calditenuaceae archaeon]MDW8186814.1 NADH-quinone oxidoreductase subunit K [Nitrososphaerota archaeon]
MYPVSIYTLFAALFFALGVYTLASKRSIIKQIVAIELMINGAHLNVVVFATAGASGVDPMGLGFVMVSLGVGAAVIAVAVILLVHVYRTTGTMDIDALRKLKR